MTALLLTLVLALGVAACSGDDDDGGSGGGDDATTEGSTIPEAGDPEAGDTPLGDGAPTPEGDDTAGEAGDASTPVPDADLPGTVFDLFPYDGAEMTVVGVTPDDVLNVRRLPAPDAARVTALDPLSSGDAVATGRNRQLDSGEIWAEVEIDGSFGWANTRFLLQAAGTTDDTATVFGSDRPSAANMLELAGLAAQEYASTEPPSEVVIVSDPIDGDLTEIVVDVLGLGDDAVGGYRVHVFAESSGSAFTVRTVETTVLCSRGVAGDACV